MWLQQLLFYCNKTPRPEQPRKKEFVLAYSSRGTGIHDGRVEAWRAASDITHGGWNSELRESSHLEQQARSREQLEVVCIFKLSKLAHGSILPPARLHLLSLPKYSYRLTTTMVYVKRLCIINQGQCMDYELSLG